MITVGHKSRQLTREGACWQLRRRPWQMANGQIELEMSLNE